MKMDGEWTKKSSKRWQNERRPTFQQVCSLILFPSPAAEQLRLSSNSIQVRLTEKANSLIQKGAKAKQTLFLLKTSTVGLKQDSDLSVWVLNHHPHPQWDKVNTVFERKCLFQVVHKDQK